MAIRFRKTLRLLPGLRINLSRTGISTSLGPKGATVNLRGGKRTLTTSVPGTGLSQRHDITPAARRTSIGGGWIALIVLALIAWFLR